jgi:hypothetical protein
VFSRIRDFTCFPHSGGASVVDYILANQDLLPHIQHLSVSPLPMVDHASSLSPSLHHLPPPLPTPPHPPRTTFLFDRDYVDSYTTRLKELLPPFPTSDHWTRPQPNMRYSPRFLRQQPLTPIPTLLVSTPISPPLAPAP